MKRKIFNFFIIFLSALILIFFVLSTQGISGLLAQLSGLLYLWLGLAFGCMIFYWALEVLILHCITKLLYQKQSWFNSLKVTMIGQFFNSITPFASGGQPVQLYI